MVNYMGCNMKNKEKAKKYSKLFFIVKKREAQEMQAKSHAMHKEIQLLIILKDIGSETEDGLVKMSQIKDILKVSPPAITKMIDRAEEKNLVERITKNDDKRNIYLKLTDKAIKIMEEKEQHLINSIEKFMDYLGEEDSDALIRIMEKVIEYGPILK